MKVNTPDLPDKSSKDRFFLDYEKNYHPTADVYFSADVETDGPIPGPYSILSFAIVYAGTFDGKQFTRPNNYQNNLYSELRPISENFQSEALRVNGLDREQLRIFGTEPEIAMEAAYSWIKEIAGVGTPSLWLFH